MISSRRSAGSSTARVQPDEAIQVLQQSTADGQINAASAYYFAVVLNDKGQTEQAKNFLEVALSTAAFAKRTEAEALLKSSMMRQREQKSPR